MLKKKIIKISRYHWELKEAQSFRKFSSRFIKLLFWGYHELIKTSASASYFLLRGVYILTYGISFSVYEQISWKYAKTHERTN